MKLTEYKKLVKPSEHQIQTEIINFLRGQGYYVQRLNAGNYAVGEGRSRRMVHGVKAGTPDIMAFKKVEYTTDVWAGSQFKDTDLLFVEVKAGKNKPTALQTEIMKELEEYGARCIVAHSREEVEQLL
jgi:site-specific DNA-cytosine methylase